MRRDVRLLGRALGVREDVGGDGPSWLGTDPAAGVTVDVAARTDEVSDVVLRFSAPIPLSALAQQFGTGEVPVQITGHWPARDVWFREGGIVLTARCAADDPSLAVELILQPAS